MSLSHKEIDHLAHLARLKLSDTQKEGLFKDLNAIVGYVDRLSEVNTDNTEPMTHALLKQIVERKDETRQTLGRKALEQSAGYEDGLNRVPKIIE
jgi:aspartyl-tRNA(Asn)/glutamyl-tRNA(Gln) amidotransferase subunit C